MAVVGGGDGMLGDRGLGLVTPMPLQSIASPGASGCLPSDSGNLGAGRGGGRGRKDDRIPQWGYHETKEFIAIRAELEKDFTQTKRNKTLWELIAGKMKEKGFRRSADQCKCKWKNLVNRYKGKELSDPENGRQCPFFEELDAIFKARAKNVDKLLLESDGLRPKKKLKQLKRGIMGVNLSDDDSEDDDEDESEDDRAVQKKKRKADKDRQRATAEKYRANSMQEVLEEFFQQQQRMEEQWREALERRDSERRIRDEEWRETMEKLESERMMREQAWWEHEEERRARDEARSQKRDDLLSALIMKVTHESS